MAKFDCDNVFGARRAVPPIGFTAAIRARVRRVDPDPQHLTFAREFWETLPDNFWLEEDGPDPQAELITAAAERFQPSPLTFEDILKYRAAYRQVVGEAFRDAAMKCVAPTREERKQAEITEQAAALREGRSVRPIERR